MKATLKFSADWTETLTGDLIQGGEIAVDYDLQRLPEYRSIYKGAAIWDIRSLVRFQPDLQILATSLTEPVYESPGGMTIDRSPVVATFAVPGDATQVELWFLNIGYAPFNSESDQPMAWDSRFGDNYVFPVRSNSPAQPVTPRQGAQTNRAVVNAPTLTIDKRRHQFGAHGSAGSEIQTRANVTAWVRNLSYVKNVWFDTNVFDSSNNLIHAESFPLHYSTGGDVSDYFELNDVLYLGSRGQPGSVTPRPDARRVQFRLYYEVNGQVFTDGILHDHPLPEDGAVH